MLGTVDLIWWIHFQSHIGFPKHQSNNSMCALRTLVNESVRLPVRCSSCPMECTPRDTSSVDLRGVPCLRGLPVAGTDPLWSTSCSRGSAGTSESLSQSRISVPGGMSLQALRQRLPSSSWTVTFCSSLLFALQANLD